VNETELRAAVLGALGEIAPEADLSALDAQMPLREQLDLDSMDFLNVVVAIHRRTGIEIPEADYRKLATLADAIAYLTTRSP